MRWSSDDVVTVQKLQLDVMYRANVHKLSSWFHKKWHSVLSVSGIVISGISAPSTILADWAECGNCGELHVMTLLFGCCTIVGFVVTNVALLYGFKDKYNSHADLSSEYANLAEKIRLEVDKIGNHQLRCIDFVADVSTSLQRIESGRVSMRLEVPKSISNRTSQIWQSTYEEIQDYMDQKEHFATSSAVKPTPPTKIPADDRIFSPTASVSIQHRHLRKTLPFSSAIDVLREQLKTHMQMSDHHQDSPIISRSSNNDIALETPVALMRSIHNQKMDRLVRSEEIHNRSPMWRVKPKTRSAAAAVDKKQPEDVELPEMLALIAKKNHDDDKPAAPTNNQRNTPGVAAHTQSVPTGNHDRCGGPDGRIMCAFSEERMECDGIRTESTTAHAP